ncbi:hypothetical protein D3C72_2180970 [compost metagenome]
MKENGRPRRLETKINNIRVNPSDMYGFPFFRSMALLMTPCTNSTTHSMKFWSLDGFSTDRLRTDNITRVNTISELITSIKTADKSIGMPPT